MATKYLEVEVGVEHRDTSFDGYRRDQAVDQLANRFAAAATRAVERGGTFVVGGLGGDGRSSSEQAAYTCPVCSRLTALTKA